jgi:hypothetical protein
VHAPDAGRPPPGRPVAACVNHDRPAPVKTTEQRPSSSTAEVAAVTGSPPSTSGRPRHPRARAPPPGGRSRNATRSFVHERRPRLVQSLGTSKRCSGIRDHGATDHRQPRLPRAERTWRRPSFSTSLSSFLRLHELELPSRPLASSASSSPSELTGAARRVWGQAPRAGRARRPAHEVSCARSRRRRASPTACPCEPASPARTVDACSTSACNARRNVSSLSTGREPRYSAILAAAGVA